MSGLDGSVSGDISPSGGGGGGGGDAGRTPTLLVVDDERALRALEVSVLEDAGYDVLSADDGLEAVAVAERHQGPIDLLITDLSMPGLAGGELARRLRARCPDLAVLFVSGYGDAEASALGPADEGGAVSTLGKPFVPDQLVERVAEMVGSADGG